ncbi:hypothetical protein EN991_38815, partial [Mesorhizobium sp. M7A.F.Ca.US.005.03.2.1]
MRLATSRNPAIGSQFWFRNPLRHAAQQWFDDVAWSGCRLNMTPSYPLGLRRIEAIQHEPRVGDIAISVRPGRRPLTLRLCAAISREVCAPAEPVRFGNSELRTIYSEGRIITAFVGGVVPPGDGFLHSRFPGSYDSRWTGSGRRHSRPCKAYPHFHALKRCIRLVSSPAVWPLARSAGAEIRSPFG